MSDFYPLSRVAFFDLEIAARLEGDAVLAAYRPASALLAQVLRGTPAHRDVLDVRHADLVAWTCH